MLVVGGIFSVFFFVILASQMSISFSSFESETRNEYDNTAK